MSTLEYIQLRDSLLMKLLKTTDVNTLEKIKKVFDNNEEEDFFNELPKQAQQKLLKSIEQADKEELISFEDFLDV